jgi:hydroxypyruvate reductase
MSIFRNYDELVGIHDELHARAIVLKILEAGVESVLPENAMKEIFEEGELELPEKVTVLGWGKASVGMLNSFSENFQGEILQGGVITQKNKGSILKKDAIEISYGAHPVPDESSLQSGEKTLDIARGLNEKDTLVCLISGGGSSMFEVPRHGIDFKSLRTIYKMLLESGADIHEINSVRRALSATKGGGLAEAAYPAKIINIIISDVPGNNLEDIASGPTVMDPFRIKPHDVLKKYAMENKIDGQILEIIQKYRPINEKYFKNVETHIIADNKKAQIAMMKKANEMGYNAIQYQDHLLGEARLAVNSFIETPGDLIIGGGETTVTVKGEGQGGRNQEFVLASLDKLGDGVLASIGTDGIDGNTDAAGAIGDQMILEEAQAEGYLIDSFLKNNNSFEFFEKCGGLLITGPTETNVADICVYLRSRKIIRS